MTVMILIAACSGNHGNTTGNQMGGSIQGQPLSLAGTVTTLAGKTTSADGTGAAAGFMFPGGITTDGTNLFVADTRNNTIRKIVIATGEVTTLAGTAGVEGATNGTGAAASFYLPSGIATDGTNLYLTDTGNSTIRKIVIATGEVTTLAGSPHVQGATNGVGAAASFFDPFGITTDGTNLYVADTYNSAIRKIVIATGAVSTLAGTPGIGGSADGIGGAASFGGPIGIKTDGSNLYVADTGNHTIRKIVIATGEVSTLAGTPGSRGFADGIGAAASFDYPYDITTDGTNLYVADNFNCTIRKIVIATGAVSTLAGTPGRAGSADGIGGEASFGMPQAVTTDGRNLYVADSGNSTIRKIVIVSATVTTLAGTIEAADGIGAAASFKNPWSMTTDGRNLYVTDTLNNTIRKVVIATGAVSTLAGLPGYSRFGELRDGIGSAARFYSPQGITTDGIYLYVADSGNNSIRKIVIATGEVTTLAGKRWPGSSDGIGDSASFYNPTGITTDGINLYVTDTFNSTIRKIVIASGEVTTLVGNPGTHGSSDGAGVSASFNFPAGITTEGTNLYVADSDNSTIRKIVIATTAVSTLAGNAGVPGSVDGARSAAGFYQPRGITTDGINLYVADSGNNTIRKIVIATGEVTTLAGNRWPGSSDGVGGSAGFIYPEGITTDGASLYVADTGNSTIRKIH